ncbi:hypothetical protein [Paenibacillus sp. FSL R7-0331]|uniref:hypothetical protein n=1 Tax=Paenibacillus sp. FSL R7-0331 TaxID=1536773 RepID=UPI000AB1D488|nr:hypothetical protein [Paenibacillus sp. FSL R7-0331]
MNAAKGKKNRRLWNGFSYLFIRTPIAALLIIAGLCGGLFIWANGLLLQHYVTVSGSASLSEEYMLVRLKGNYDSSYIEISDTASWYLSADGRRYTGTVVAVQAEPGRSTVELEISRSEWTRANTESGKALSGQQVYVEIPQGQRSLWFKMIHKGERL